MHRADTESLEKQKYTHQQKKKWRKLRKVVAALEEWRRADEGKRKGQELER